MLNRIRAIFWMEPRIHFPASNLKTCCKTNHPSHLTHAMCVRVRVRLMHCQTEHIDLRWCMRNRDQMGGRSARQCRVVPTCHLFTLNVVLWKVSHEILQHGGRKPRAQHAWSLIFSVAKQLVAGASKRFGYNIEMYPGWNQECEINNCQVNILAPDSVFCT